MVNEDIVRSQRRCSVSSFLIYDKYNYLEKNLNSYWLEKPKMIYSI